MAELIDERAKVKSIMESCSLIEGGLWHVISNEWFQTWMLYVDYNLSGAADKIGVKQSFPGAISNDELLKDCENVILKRHITEGKDFMLIPSAAYQILHEHYGGGPEIVRKVVNTVKIGTHLSIEIFPIFISCLTCKDDGNVEKNISSSVSTTSQKSTTSSIMLPISNYATLKDLYSTIEIQFKIPSYESSGFRLWVKTMMSSSNGSIGPLGTDIGRKSSSTATSSQSAVLQELVAKKTKTEKNLFQNGTQWTVDRTDVVDGWRYIREGNSEDVRVTQIFDTPMSEDINIFILVEINRAPASTSMVGTNLGKSPPLVIWPRDKMLNAWRNQLKVGDLVNAKDTDKKWFEAVIKKINGNGEVDVHFLGWGSRWDMTVPVKDLQAVIMPLYSQTRNWRVELAVDTLVEVKSTSGSGYNLVEPNPKWLSGTVTEVDAVQDRILVEYIAIPKLYGTGSLEKKWFDIYTEDVCEIYTHTKPLVTADPVKSTSLVATSSVNSSYGSGWGSRRSHTKGKSLMKGVVGLSNLGNTCFMASMLQCLSNTQQVTEVFLGDAYKADINETNALGHGGKLAKVYAKLMVDMWSDNYSVVCPDEFKQTIGEFAPQFAGYQQQDSQEFMLFLLDGLHEDLNRVRKKPHVGKIESKGRPDQIVSVEAWRRYLLRNDSYLVDNCFGQLKSHVTCTGCGNESVTFEAFSCLSLPIPIKSTQTLSVIFYPLPLGTRPVILHFEVPPSILVSEFKKLFTEKWNSIKHEYISVPKPAGNTAAAAPASVVKGRTDTSMELDEEEADVVKVSYKDAEESGSEMNISPVHQLSKAYDYGTSATAHPELVGTDVSPANSETTNDSNSSYVLVNGCSSGDDLDILTSTTKMDVEVPLSLPETSTTHIILSHMMYVRDLAKSVEPMNDNADIPKLRSDDVILVQELSHPYKPPKHAYNSYNSAYNSSASGLYGNSTAKASPVSSDMEEPTVAYVDVVIGHWKRKATSTSNFRDMNGLCFRRKLAYDLSHNKSTITSTTTGIPTSITTPTTSSKISTDDVDRSNYVLIKKDSLVPSSSNLLTTLNSNSVPNLSGYTSKTSPLDPLGLCNLIEGTSDGSTSSAIPSHNIQQQQISKKSQLITRRDVHRDIWKLIEPSIRLNSEYKSYENRPYTVYYCMGYISDKTEFPEDYELFNPEDRAYLVVTYKDEIILDETVTPTSLYANPVLSKAHIFHEMLLPEDFSADSYSYSSIDEPKNVSRFTLQSCLDKFVEREALAKEQTWYCAKCKQHLAPIKKFDIWAAPDVLVLHLKRFQYTPSSYTTSVLRDKISDLVDFPLTGLDLSAYVKGTSDNPSLSHIYDLYGVSEHSGGLGGGHYTACCKNFLDNNWYNFNDSSVSVVSDTASLVSTRAYVLFYKRRGPSAKWAGICLPPSTGLEDEVSDD